MLELPSYLLSSYIASAIDQNEQNKEAIAVGTASFPEVGDDSKLN